MILGDEGKTPMTVPDRTTCRNPATGEILGHSALNSIGLVGQAFGRARQVQPAWSQRPVRERVRYLNRVRAYIAENADELAEIISRDNGKTRTDALASEVLPAAMAVDYYCRNAVAFLKDRRIRPGNLLMANKVSRIIRVPYGVVGIISPWNYPFSIPFSEVVMALLAGNAVLLKVATETQLVGRAIERCLAAAGLPEGLFAYLNLPGRIAGTALLEAGVDKLFFTGSVAVGQTLMAEAARTLTPVVLELGGNDPMLVCADADPERAAAGAVWAGLQNCGQSCAGVERIYVHRAILPAFMAGLRHRVERLRVGYDTDYRVDLGAMTTAKQVQEVRRQVRQALDSGAIIAAQSPAPAGTAGNFLPAMVLTGVTHAMDIMRLETFGPVLGVMVVDDMQEALALANDSDLGLTASVWARDARSAVGLARQIKAGVVTINDHLMSHGLAETPWGGFKRSGIGRSHGAEGMAEMTQPQCLVNDILPAVKKNFWWHPHGPEIYQGVRGVIDLLYGKGLGQRLRGLKKLLRVFPRTFSGKKE
jgi:acyl-CoA reductase-like NAD-dependent aldehyde dehydrogenase